MRHDCPHKIYTHRARINSKICFFFISECTREVKEKCGTTGHDGQQWSSNGYEMGMFYGTQGHPSIFVLIIESFYLLFVKASFGVLLYGKSEKPLRKY